MEEYWYVICANCNRQVLIGGSEDRCYFCLKNASRKEETMQEAEEPGNPEETIELGSQGEILQENKVTVEAPVVPPRPQKRKKLWPYFLKNKEAILADYHSMTLLKFFKKWGITSTTWIRLKKEWGVPSKGRGGVHLAKDTGDKRVKRLSADDTQMTEHERYLILVGYQMAVREFLSRNS